MPWRITFDGPLADAKPLPEMMPLWTELNILRLQTKDHATKIKTHHTQHDKLSDQYGKQNAELVALKQEMNVMKENVVNDTATRKHLRSVIAIQKKWGNQAETLRNQIEDTKPELIECKNNKRTPTEMQRAELQRLKEVHDASRAPVTDEEKQVVLKTVEAFDATETQ